jgi:AmiR/NasT family two-component response regulator
MNHSLRIAVADDEPDMRDYLQKILPHLGHQVTSVARNGRELVQQCQTSSPDLVITDIKMPEMDGIDAAKEICRTKPIPVILVTAYEDPELIERAESNHVLAYLVKPVKQANLGPAITLAMRRFEQFQALAKEATDLRQSLENRKIIERAKGVVMKRIGVDEQEAFRRLNKLARDRNWKIADMAQKILVAEETFQELDRC